MDIPKKYISNCKDIYLKDYSFEFLKFIAQHGYTLKKNNQREDFIDFQEEVKELEEMSQIKIAASAGLRKWLIRDSDNPFYLPDFLKDFHDAKEFFKAYERAVDNNILDRVTGGLYCSDYFLFFLARYGYFLRKNNKKLNFKSIENLIKENNEKELSILLKMFNSK